MKILKKCLTCGAEFIASKMSNKYCCRECERDASRKREAKRKKSVRESEKEAALWGIERSGFFNGQGKWAKGFENQMV